jgi:hypothetical protein
MKIGDKVIIRAEGPFYGEEGVVVELPKSEIKGPGFELTLSVDQQTASVKIFGGALGLIVKPSELEFV